MDAVIWAGMVIAVVAWYPVSCALHPYRDCSVCSGTGSHRRHDDRTLSRPCWWCKGAGKRLRYGARLTARTAGWLLLVSLVLGGGGVLLWWAL